MFHVDQRDRASLALDLMEAVRPAVDAYVLALLTQRTLAPSNFTETRDGGCRIAPRLASELADTTETWRHYIAPVAEWATHTLSRHARSRLPLLTPLTRTNWKQSRDRRAPDRRQRRTRAEFAALPHTCADCGTALHDRRRRLCDTCRAQRLAERGLKARNAAATVLAQLRTEQRDPAHGGRAAYLRGAKNAAHQAAVHEWTGGTGDPKVFAREILPQLSAVKVTAIAAATGLSEHYCSMIRLGKKVPHPRHWETLRHVRD